ncbi:hypothetical protein QN224_31015 [Sinorhizobium sp. 8-89]|uniref:hypothetical protein n=1 Tax=Sinorhizobium sp. 7-81 TaxID=3049087 RepID=UPI0024C42281|nr:hypothetical protein [Sinorhizobium sp. 7-81]MDK1389781.1 hypothetical protein [Sinorhizobium sp. 7-81]
MLPLTALGAEIGFRWPSSAIVLKAIAAIWVMYLAIKLWGVGKGFGNSAQITFSRVFATTMLNPKALVFALVLLPSPHDKEFLSKLCIFAILVIGVAILWSGLGTIIGRHGRQ